MGPESETWQHILDWRLLLGSGRALVLQVAHPTVGAGVAQYSNFQKEPWQRLQRTVDSLMLVNYGQDRVAGEARRLRELHKDIKGIDHHGNRYHALNPEAYAWVHATLFEATVDLHAQFARPLPWDVQQRMYAEWRDLGFTLGLTARHLPVDLPQFSEYFADMVANRLEDNETVRTVIASFAERRPIQPPWWPLPNVLWRLVGPVGSTIAMTTLVGTLPPVFRRRLGLSWTDWDQRRLGALKVAVRAGMPLVPPKLRFHPLALDARRLTQHAVADRSLGHSRAGG